MGNNEKQSLSALLFSCGVSKERVDALQDVITNVEWMREKLDDARAKIAGSSVAIPYDNGGGQTGIRENPLFKGYSSLWKSYISGLQIIMAALPKGTEIAPEADEPKTVLQIVRNRKKGA